MSITQSAHGIEVGASPRSHDARIELHENSIPARIEYLLEQRYGSLYASLPQLRLSGLEGVGSYVDWPDGSSRPSAIFLFRRDGAALRVINEGMQLTMAEAERFAMYLFGHLPGLRSVHWHAIIAGDGMPGQARLPAACFDCSEDIVLDLPSTADAYLQALGKATRKSLRQRLARAHGLVHQIVQGDDAAAAVDGIVAFNHARMKGKARHSALDETATGQLKQLMQARGLAGLARINGALCGGTLACRIGDDVYSLVNAHDPAHDRLGLGNLCRHLMILYAIATGARRFHLLGGNYASKRACLARRITLQHLVLHRHRLAWLADWPALAGLWFREWELRWRRRIDDYRHRPH